MTVEDAFDGVEGDYRPAKFGASQCRKPRDLRKASVAAAAGAKKESLQERVFHELKKFAVITLNLWVLFLLFATYKHMLLQKNGINIWTCGFAIVNAFICGVCRLPRGSTR